MKKPPTTNPPERFEEHWHEHRNTGWWIIPACIGGIGIWFVVLMIMLTKYL